MAQRVRDPLSGPGVTRVTPAPPVVYDAFGRQYQAPVPPRLDRSHAGVIYRDLPVVTTGLDWLQGDDPVTAVRDALEAHMAGQFSASALLWDAMSGDDRIHASLGSRVGALFGLPTIIECEDESIRAAWTTAWEAAAPPAVQADVQRWALGMGFCISELRWDTSVEPWQPYVHVWHPTYSRYDTFTRTYRVMTMDGEVEVTPGDGRWFLHAPWGADRGWLWGAVRPLALPWMLRQFAYRDWARYSERHGMPMVLAHVPMVGDGDDKDEFVSALQTMGNEAVVRLPRGIDGQDFDLDLLEATANTWQGFLALITKCDTAITLTLQWQNLTTEVKEGSQAAARVHADVKQTAVEFDDRTLTQAIGAQVARPWVVWNYGEGRPVPVTSHDTSVTEDHAAAASVLESLSRSVASLTAAGINVDPVALARSYGVRLPLLEARAEAPIFGYHLDAGIITTDEVRARLGLPPLGGEAGSALVGAEPATPPGETPAAPQEPTE